MTKSKSKSKSKVPGMAVQALANEIVVALRADENGGHIDLTAGMFGKQFSTLVRRWAQAEWDALAEAPVEDEAWAAQQQKNAVYATECAAAAIVNPGDLMQAVRDYYKNTYGFVSEDHGGVTWKNNMPPYRSVVAPVQQGPKLVATPAMHTAIRHVLQHHGYTEHGDGVVESDLIYALLPLCQPPQRKPLPAHEIVTMYDECPTSDSCMVTFARAVEAAHGIKQ